MEAYCVGLTDALDALREFGDELGDDSLSEAPFEAVFGADYQISDCLTDWREGGEFYEAVGLGGAFDDPIASGYVAGCAVPYVAALDTALPEAGLEFHQSNANLTCGLLLNPFAQEFMERSDFGMSYEVRFDGLCWNSTGGPDAIREGIEGWDWCS